ncbi:DUF493 domain-containing protein [Wohlfahrtiimonas chitiniclastica]|uniref:Uncharacterized protein n=2 Tax=Wohlfahrtiimonas chitiniclastica TaxID=400946 RepID=L8XUM0_9GAMM|nr:DUF493 domain-containing protein [Wohlfahrtiimonas chitiniclastica]ELV07602.1 Hypothetical protein F387_01406 [Wohlfahrtiimonas chitiniclastica SH04]KZS23586.1 hypothetical protein BMY_1453 [Wohlfahrtiimonas chitiniclastica]KZX36350.1 hypothetical protein A6V30_08120 [Wohlfahrtiimonas chitiniclastica]MBS7814859.1 DUF493 domain-containing protein [Wohlfahrtiimonas chitiniclastica]MBS7816988.1 DUF493 domain-containing protein [Wohlfahrtiimonas chitiniclastica]
MINPETKQPLVDFPTHFLFKITGKNEPNFESDIIALLKKVDPTIDDSKITRKLSSSDKYLSLSVNVWVTKQEEIDEVYSLLKAEPRVVWAL